MSATDENQTHSTHLQFSAPQQRIDLSSRFLPRQENARHWYQLPDRTYLGDDDDEVGVTDVASNAVHRDAKIPVSFLVVASPCKIVRTTVGGSKDVREKAPHGCISVQVILVRQGGILIDCAPKWYSCIVPIGYSMWLCATPGCALANPTSLGPVRAPLGTAPNDILDVDNGEPVKINRRSRWRCARDLMPDIGLLRLGRLATLPARGGCMERCPNSVSAHNQRQHDLASQLHHDQPSG
ncbi:hypothetical protein BX600DRAFT_429657 [Xylariales sp. PMI_506]|nr:hypothetical protein BX600DRAFT_429657 [Xylariales sp. PMI_506]